jgi:hypothetical protein
MLLAFEKGIKPFGRVSGHQLSCVFTTQAANSEKGGAGEWLPPLTSSLKEVLWDVLETPHLGVSASQYRKEHV